MPFLDIQEKPLAAAHSRSTPWIFPKNMNRHQNNTCSKIAD